MENRGGLSKGRMLSLHKNAKPLRVWETIGSEELQHGKKLKPPSKGSRGVLWGEKKALAKAFEKQGAFPGRRVEIGREKWSLTWG